MNGWMDELIDRWMDEMNGRMDGQLRWIDKQINRWMDEMNG